MKNLKKVIALVAVLAMVLSTVALGATYTDVAEDSAYSTAVESLSKLGIVTGYEDGTYGPEKSVTRAEMAALIARIQGYGETAKAQTNTAFTDVPSSHWASGYVAYAANQNIVNGYGDGTFGPDDTVKYEQAVTMIMRTLGFEYFATTNGGYPTGYLAAATRYGLTNGVSNAVVGSEANRGTIAQLLYNGIDTPIMAPFKWNTNGEVEYAVYDGTDAVYKTLMSENLGVVKIKGVVLANKAVDITGAKSIDLSATEAVNVHIVDTYDSTNDAFKAYANYTITQMENGIPQYDAQGNQTGTVTFTKEFLVGDSDIADFIGKRVVLYAVEDKNVDKFVVVSAALDSTTNKTAEFTLEQYSDFDTTGTKDKVQYFKSETDKNATDLVLESAVNVVYNNVGGYTTAIFGTNGVTKNSPYGGKITLIDNDSTSGYDVIFIEVGATAVVDEVSGTKVVFKESAELANGDTINYIKVDADAEDEIFAFYKDGAEIAVTDLKEWDVLTLVAAADNSDYITAEVINTTVSGAIGATSSSVTSATGYKYAIDGKKYDVAYGNYKANKLQYGDAGIFYIDKYGKIAAFSEDASVTGGVAGNYGFVLYSAYETSTMKDSVYVVKLLTANGAELFDVASKVSYYYAGDDTRYTLDSAKAFKNTTDGSGTVKPSGSTAGSVEFNARNQFELIKYTTNSAGEINAIYEAGYDPDKFAFVADVDDDYDADNLKLGKALDENATVFFLASSTTGATPVNGSNGFVKNDVINVGGTNYKINTSSSTIGTLADLIDDEDYTAKLYVDNKGELGNLLVVTTGWGKTAASSSIAVVTDVATAQNDDFDDCQILSYYVDGELKEGVYTTNDAMDLNLSEGDIVKLSVASSGVITAVDILVDFGANIRNANGTIGGSLQKTVNGKDKYFFGYGDAYTKGTKALTIGANTFRLGSAQNVYVVDASLKVGRVDVGASGDFAWDKDVMTNADKAKYADYVFAREYDGRVEEIVIIKNIIDYADDNTITLEGLNELADEYYTAYTTAKAAYEADTTDADLKAAVIDAANAAYDAAVAANAEDSTYDLTNANAAKAYIAGL